MPGPIYKAPPVKLVTASDIPDYQPTSVNWRPAPTGIQSLMMRNSPSPQISPPFPTPKIEETLQMSKKLLVADNPSHIMVTGASNNFGPVPPDVLAYWAYLFRSQKARECRGVKRKGFDGKSKSAIKSNPAKRLCLPLRIRCPKARLDENPVFVLPIRPI